MDTIFTTKELTIIVTKIQQEMQEYRELIARTNEKHANYESWLEKTKNYFRSTVNKKMKRTQEYILKLNDLEIEIDKTQKRHKRLVTKLAKMENE